LETSKDELEWHNEELSSLNNQLQDKVEELVSANNDVANLLKSTDVAHGLRFREFDVDAKADKGKTGELSFTPTKVGDFVGQCSVFCGSGHGRMKLTLHVVE
jgi:cytochrome c oxidase subunit 2